jgi:DNA end-binding protein Ku
MGYVLTMARAIWSGSISFGLVNIPVKLYSATRDHKVHFHQLDKKSGSRIRYEKVAEKTGKEVDSEDIQLGYEMSKGELVVVDPGELDELRPRTTRTIDISDFVDLAEVDPVYYNRTYWLAPDGEAASRAYRLLGAAMQERGRVGVGMVVMRNRQYLAAIRPREGALALSTMRFADEVLDVGVVEGIPSKSVKVDSKEKQLATQIIDSLSGNWKPEKYHDTYTEEVQKLVAAHQKGRDVLVEEAPAAQAEVVDLMEALEASLKAARSRGDRSAALQKAAERLNEEAEAQADADSDSRRKSTGSRRPAAREAKGGTKKAGPKTSRSQKTAQRKSA